MDEGLSYIFEFEGFRIDAHKRLLFNAEGKVCPLMPKAFDILLYLVQRAGTVVEKDEIISAIWPDTIVEENNLTQNISILRRILGEKHGENRFIATIPGLGYKFVANVMANRGSESGKRAVSGGELKLPDHLTQPLRRFLINRAVFVSIGGIVLIGLVVFGFIGLRKDTGLEKATDTTGGAKIRSLAVLPFKPLVAEHRNEEFEKGITNALILRLGSSEQIRVRSLATVLRFGSIDQDAVTAGNELGVEAVLDGRVQLDNERVRITATLVRVSDQKQLWADTFDRQAGDIFRLQDLIAENVAATLEAKLGNVRDYTSNVEAYTLYNRGYRLVEPEVLKGIQYYEQAIAIDPDYTLAYIGLSHAYRALVLTNDSNPADAMRKAKEAALSAVDLDPNLADAHVALASSLFWFDWDWQAAEKHFRTALDLDPKNSLAHVLYAHLLSNTGRHPQAVEEFRKGIALDPANLYEMALGGQFLTFAGNYDEAFEILSRVVEMQPNLWLPHLFLSRWYIEMEMYDEAIVSAAKARDLSGGNSEAVATLGYALAKTGKLEEAMKIDRELEKRSTQDYVSAYILATTENALGNTSEALSLLELSEERRDALMVFLKVEKRWDNLRKEPRFIALMRRMKFE